MVTDVHEPLHLVVLEEPLQLLQVLQVPLIVQGGVVLDDLVVEHYEVLYYLRVRRATQRLLIELYFVKEGVDLVDARVRILLAFLLLLVVLVHYEPLLLEGLDYQVDAVVSVLHDHLELSQGVLAAIAVIPPDEGDTVRAV